LGWLRTQTGKHAAQRLFFRCRDGDFAIGAVGFAHTASGSAYSAEAHASLLKMLDPKHADMRFYGARRFDDTPKRHVVVPQDPRWEPYKGYTFVLPAVELLLTRDDCVLACNLVSGDENAHDAAVEWLCTLLAALQQPPASPRPPLVPQPLSVHPLTTFGQWDAAMSAILDNLAGNRYAKIVLARRKEFCFASVAPPDILSIVAALDEPMRPPLSSSYRPHPASSSPALDSCDSADSVDGDVQQTFLGPDDTRGSYLFCLQLDHGRAFIGCTPERLFRVEGPQLLTQALAGTVRRAAEHDERAAIAELRSSKNMQEHRFVVDYIHDALAAAGLVIRTRGPRTIRLPRLMHLATDISGHLPLPEQQQGKDDDVGDAPTQRLGALVHTLLETLHPTPAVCGMPREQTMADLPGLEGFDRGLYAGPLGWFSHNASDFCVAIRSARVSENVVTAYAGCGIVSRSESLSEWDESELKMSALTDMFGATSISAIQAAADDRCRITCNVPNANGKACTNGEGNGSAEYGHHELSSSSSASSSDDTSSRACRVRPVMAPSGVDALASHFDSRHLDTEPNLNSLWGCAVAEELCRNGVDEFFVCPGSRSAPLAVGVVRSRRARFTVAHDERGAGFMAVGYARATGRAAAVITSSGTAVANLLPALIEAFNDKLPVVVLTADRPPELRDVGANQAIDQTKLFGAYTRWFKDVPCPTDEIPLRNLLSDVDHAAYMSGSSQVGNCGPVHLNFMFREKLAPDAQTWSRLCLIGISQRWTHGVAPQTVYASNPECGALPMSSQPQASDISRILTSCRRVLVVVGGGCGGGGGAGGSAGDDALAILRLAETMGWPVVADIASGMRLDRLSANLVPYGDLLFASGELCRTAHLDGVVQFGERVTSKRVTRLMSSCHSMIHVVVSPSSTRVDPSFSVSHRFVGSPQAFVTEICREATCGRGDIINENSAISDSIMAESGISLLDLLRSVSKRVDAHLSSILQKQEQGSSLVEPWVARVLSSALPSSSALFVGNSMPIRYLDTYASCCPPGKRSSAILVGANRGASGIDGVLSSGIGFARGSGRPTFVVIGDMSFLHDLNALHMLRPSGDGGIVCPSVTLVIINNGGGGIFSLLPIANHCSVFTPVFDTPHGVTFEQAAKTFSIPYVSVRTVHELDNCISTIPSSHRVVEVHVPCDHTLNATLHRGFVSDVVDLLESRN
jgi:2-succinyl-5-enolpyruvyl-6-hydroxy-3-cyclohexene-1-carboxylate synthase